MSKERELIKDMKILLECTAMGGLQRNSDVLIGRATELLAQPKQEPEQELIAKYREGYKKGFLDGAEPESEQKPLTGKEISHGFRCDDDATNAESYWAGVEYAEKHYGIGADDEDEARNTN